MAKVHRLLSIERQDLPRLGALAPSFAVVAACTVILASLSKALFLATNPIRLLPWMFLGAAAITALSSLGYVALMRTMRLEGRFRLLLAVAIVSLGGLRLAFPTAPAALGIAILLWCPTVGHLLVVQTWNVATSLLPTRQGKRMMPLLAAVTTLGAAVGGMLVQALLRWLATEDLLAVVAVALLFPLARLRHTMDRLGGDEVEAPANASSPPPPTERADDEGEIAAGFASIRKRPLLTDLAVLTFLLQAASLVVDYQFSAEIKPRFDKEGIASFLGTYFWTSNVLVLALTLLLTSRFIRAVGIGVALAASGVVIGLGSGLYVLAAVTAMLPMFWVITATAFAERVASYAFSKPAVQMAYMPLQMSGGERAKTIIDGVIYRLATAVVSVLLLVASPDLASQFRLSLPAVIACVVVFYVGLRIGPHYRHALMEALRTRRLDANLLAYLRNGLGGGAVDELEEQLRSGDPRRILNALEVSQELAVALSPELVEELAEHEDERVAKSALALMEALGRHPPPELLARMLAPDRPPRILRALLVLLTSRATPSLGEVVRPLTRHEDPAVASAACLFRIRAAGADASFDAEVQGRTAMIRLTGMTRAGVFARELPDLARHPSAEVRHDAIEQMGELQLDLFVPPLIACTDIADAREQAAAALVRFGDRSIDAICDHLLSPELALSTRALLLTVLERIGTARADAALVEAADGGASVLRDHALEALWRRASSSRGLATDAPRLQGLAGRDIEALARLVAIERALGAEGAFDARSRFLAAEVTALQRAAERRIFRVLGLLYDRNALQRAFLHYRSEETRVRSNALELLEQHIVDPDLRAFVGLVERAVEVGATSDRMPDEPVGELVASDPWLRKLWAWVSAGREAPTLRWEEPLDRLAQVASLPLFAGVAAEPLLALAGRLERRQLEAGEAAYRADASEPQIFWLLDGEVALQAGGGPDVVVRARESFGEMAVLDGRPRCCDAVALEDSVVTVASQADFEGATTLFPVLLRRLVGVLSTRLRARIA